MPIFAMTKQTKANGLQTFSHASRLPAPLRDVELQYLSIRDHYMNEVARRDQFEEALEQAKAAGNEEDCALFRRKIHRINSSLTDLRQRVRSAGEKSWAEAYFLAASAMLPLEAKTAIEDAANRLIGRERHELSKARKKK
ncbi:MAG: hypothetical protein AAGI03_17935 [Pseudomonadota bacterium]